MDIDIPQLANNASCYQSEFGTLILQLMAMSDEDDYGKTTAEMTNYYTFLDNGWDFLDETGNGSDDYWGINMNENNGYPYLYWEQYDHNPCSNPTDGGIIAGAQTICYNTQPGELTSTFGAAGHSGTLEYKWQQSTTSGSEGVQDISSSNSATYSPGNLTHTTWYRRLARVNSIQNSWQTAATSNVIEITVHDQLTLTCPEDITVNNDASICGAEVSFNATADGTTDPAVIYKIGETLIESPYNFDVGTTTVYVTATNDCGTVSCSFDVIVSEPLVPGEIATYGETIYSIGDPSLIQSETSASEAL